MKFLDTQKLISPNQHGFQKGKSTATAIYTFLQATYEALDCRQPTIGLFYDMSKAFDLMDHKILEATLSEMGIRGVTLSWISSFLSNRKHCVEIQSQQGNRITSEFRTTSTGVPQGTVLGPLLYILYVNALPAHLGDGTITTYADDTSHLITAPDITALHHRANEAASHMTSWCDNAKLIVNTSKSQCLHFHLPHTIVDSSLIIKLRNKNLHTCTETKFLGILINDTLNWSSHVDHVMKKLASAPYLLRHLRKVAGEQSVRAAYFSYVHSHLTYGIIFWGAAPQASRIFKQQKRIVRALVGASYKATCRPIFIKKRLLTFFGVFIYCSILHAVTNNTLPSTPATEQTITRNKTYYTQPRHSTRAYEKSPLYQGHVLFNNLPKSIKDLRGTSSLKTELKIYLCDLCPYSLNEFYAIKGAKY
jgi:hypothetical protein